MEVARFIFWTALKTLSLVFLGLLAAKTVAGLRLPAAVGQGKRFGMVRGALYVMNAGATRQERWTLGLLACIAAITFFFPLISLHIPIAGDQDISGYDVASKMREFREHLTSKTENATGLEKAPAESQRSINLPPVTEVRIPASLESAWLVGVLIITAFVCSLATLAGCLFSSWLSKAASTLGALCGLAAALQIRIINSDVHSFLQQSIKASTENLKENPFAGLAQSLGDLFVNAFQLKPGGGLYVLTGSLALAAFIAYSRLLSPPPSAVGQGKRFGLVLVRGALYGLILVLVVLGAREVGLDVAAQNYAWTSEKNLAQFQLEQAYANALRAVARRPGALRYWQTLAQVKLVRRQFASVVADMPILQTLSGGKLDEEDAYRLAACYYYLAEYDKVIPLTQQMIKENRVYAAAYVLQGFTYTAQKKYPEAQRTFLEVLQMFPSQQAAVEGLAHVHFLRGDTAGARDVLDQTAKFPFPPEARKRFAALKALYAQ